MVVEILIWHFIYVCEFLRTAAEILYHQLYNVLKVRSNLRERHQKLLRTLSGCQRSERGKLTQLGVIKKVYIF